MVASQPQSDSWSTKICSLISIVWSTTASTHFKSLDFCDWRSEGLNSPFCASVKMKIGKRLHIQKAFMKYMNHLEHYSGFQAWTSPNLTLMPSDLQRTLLSFQLTFRNTIFGFSLAILHNWIKHQHKPVSLIQDCSLAGNHSQDRQVE